MLLSADEAENVWCPFGRALMTASNETRGIVAMAAVNRGTDSDKGTNCLANACMAWRWAGWETDFGTVAPAPPDDAKTGPRLGYCGLAGKPYRAV